MIIVLVATTDEFEAAQRRSEGTKVTNLDLQLIANGNDAEHQEDFRLPIHCSNSPIVDLSAPIREREFAHDTLGFNSVSVVKELPKVEGKLTIVGIICRVCSIN